MLWIYALLQFLFIIGLEIGAVLDFKYYKEGKIGKLVLVSGGMQCGSQLCVDHCAKTHSHNQSVVFSINPSVV